MDASLPLVPSVQQFLEHDLTDASASDHLATASLAAALPTAFRDALGAFRMMGRRG